MQNSGALMTRRDAMTLISLAAGTAGGAEFFSAWLSAAEPQDHEPAAPPEPDRWTNYRPQFFSGEEFKALDAFTNILIPTDETPGAREAHVAPFIDFVVNAAAEYAPETQQQWREAMKWLSEHQFGRMDPAGQLALIEQMSGPERNTGASHDGFPAYQLIKEMTVRAFYTSRAGLIENLEYKGNAYLTAFPGCNHHEHKQV